MSVNLSRPPGDLTALSALSSSWLTADSALSTKFLCSSSSAIFIAMHGGGSRSSSLSLWLPRTRTGIVSLFESSKKKNKKINKKRQHLLSAESSAFCNLLKLFPFAGSACKCLSSHEQSDAESADLFFFLLLLLHPFGDSSPSRSL